MKSPLLSGILLSEADAGRYTPKAGEPFPLLSSRTSHSGRRIDPPSVPITHHSIANLAVNRNSLGFVSLTSSCVFSPLTSGTRGGQRLVVGQLFPPSPLSDGRCYTIIPDSAVICLAVVA